MSWLQVVIVAVLTVVLIGAAGALFVPAVMRRLLAEVLRQPMSDTLAELYVSTRSTPLMVLLYTSLRSQKGDIVIRPMGSAKPAHGFDDLSLIPAQLARHPVLETDPVDLSVTLGEKSGHGVKLSLPLYISGMAYGLALKREARIAMAKASGRVGIPLSSGQGPMIDEEVRLASSYILQFGRWVWNREVETLRKASLLEIQVGQGAMPGNAVIATPDEIGPEIREMMKLKPGQAPIIHRDLFLKDPSDPSSLREVVDYLRSVVDVPLSLKMGAGDHLERDIDVAVDAGVDIIVIDGTEGATGNAPITLSDHFGIPSLDALVRARRHLQRLGRENDIDLCISGGFREPGDFLKAYALGAKAVGLATVVMFALAHPQITESVPFHPPTDLVFYRANPKIPLDVDRAADAVTNYFESCRKEMALAIQTMGHRSVSELSPADVCALDPVVARICNVPFSGTPRDEARQEDETGDLRGKLEKLLTSSPS